MAKNMGTALEYYERRTDASAKRSAPAVREGEMRAAYMQVLDKARMGVGIDGMPLKKGQNGPTLPESIAGETDPKRRELYRLTALRYSMVREHRSGAEIMQICDRIRELKEELENAGASDL